MTLTDDTLTLPVIGAGPTYTNQRIWLPQLILEASYRREAIIEDRTFIDCTFEGPAVLLPVQGCSFNGCSMGETMGDARNLMLNPMGPSKVTGAVPFKNCTFTNCQFLRVGFTGSSAFVNDLVSMLQGPAS